MKLKYGNFELPVQIKVDESNKKNNFARFIAEPFERGFGYTIGNTLRRILLTSMEAPAIISVKIEGVPHEYTAVEGIIEDMTVCILNLKGALLRRLALEEEHISRDAKIVTSTLDITADMLDKNGGQYVVRLRDLLGQSDFELMNPEHPIFTVTKPMIKRVDIKIAYGRGYVPSERHILENKVVDEIVIDSAFSPVRLVNYYVENTRVGQDTDFDKLILEITTDGRITPEEALNFSAQIGILHLKVFDHIKIHDLDFDSGESESSTDKDALLNKLAIGINEIELSVRSANCLEEAGIESIAELVMKPESDMLKFRNFGKKSLTEIKQKLDSLNLHLGMNLSSLGITFDNVKQIMQEHRANKAQKHNAGT